MESITREVRWRSYSAQQYWRVGVYTWLSATGFLLWSNTGLTFQCGSNECVVKDTWDGCFEDEPLGLHILKGKQGKMKEIRGKMDDETVGKKVGAEYNVGSSLERESSNSCAGRMNLCTFQGKSRTRHHTSSCNAQLMCFCLVQWNKAKKKGWWNFNRSRRTWVWCALEGI